MGAGRTSLWRRGVGRGYVAVEPRHPQLQQRQLLTQPLNHGGTALAMMRARSREEAPNGVIDGQKAHFRAPGPGTFCRAAGHWPCSGWRRIMVASNIGLGGAQAGG